MRSLLLQQHLRGHTILYIIPHHHTIYWRWLLTYTIVFLVLTIGYDIVTLLLGSGLGGWIRLVFGLAGVGVLLHAVIQFLNIYMDTIVILANGMALFNRDGLLRYKTDFFDRVKVDTIQHERHGVMDAILQKGSLVIKLDGDIIYAFENVPQPQKRMQKILAAKQTYLHNLSVPVQEEFIPNEEKIGSQQVEVLVEALGELLVEYQQKKSKALE